MRTRHGTAMKIEMEVSGPRAVRVLIVTDERPLREAWAEALVEEGYDARGCGSGDAARLISRERADVVLIDLGDRPGTSRGLLQAALDARPDTRVILTAGDPSVRENVAALNAGAWGYLARPFAIAQLTHLLAGARREILGGGDLPASPGLPQRGEAAESYSLIGRSPAFLRVVELTRKVAGTSASVFVTGEPGTGKEMIAQFLHHNSDRHGKPLVAVNCCARPESLLESELFGQVKGAFTGATRDQAGLLEIADHSTLFLDEVTEMPLPLQAKLLRVLQDGSVRRVGSERADARVDVRFIASSDRDPRTAVSEGRLRSDLYFRLGVVPIEMPPLRDRTEDIPLLAEYFLRKYWALHRDPRAPRPALSDDAAAFLTTRHWPGNVRELQNVIEHAVVLLDPAANIHPADLAFGAETHLAAPAKTSAAGAGEWVRRDWSNVEYHEARDRVLGSFEHSYVTSVLRRAGFNMSKAAKMAGVDRTTLYRLMEKHGLERETHIRR